MYGVLVCPRCKRAKAVDLKQKTTTCSCGFTIPVQSTRVWARAETARGIAPLVGRVSAELAGGLDAYRKTAAPVPRKRSRDPHVRVVGIASKSRDRVTRLRVAAVELTREFEVFSLEDWARVLSGLGIPSPEGALESLIRTNFVIEPTGGFYRAVSLNP